MMRFLSSIKCFVPQNSQISTILILTIGSSPRKGKGWMDKTIFTREYRVVVRLLRTARLEAGLTQVDLAGKLGITQSLLSKMERGDRRVDVIELRSLCAAMGLELPDFVRRLERELRGK